MKIAIFFIILYTTKNAFAAYDWNNHTKQMLHRDSESKILRHDIIIDKEGKMVPLKEAKRAKKDDGDHIYLQSIAYKDDRNWGIVLNNINIRSDGIRNVNNVVNVVNVTKNTVTLEIITNTINCSKSKYVMHRGNKNYFEIEINHFFDMKTCEIHSGNLDRDSYYISRD